MADTRTISRRTAAGETREDACDIVLTDLFGYNYKDALDQIERLQAEQIATHAVFGTPVWRVTITAPKELLRNKRST